MIYFDNAASGGRKPDCVQSAVYSAIKACANPGRSGHQLALACARTVQETRKTLNDFFGGYGFERVVFTKNCTEALNLALFGVLQKGDHVITTPMEHNSVLRPLAHLQRLGIISYDVCTLSPDGNVTPQAIRSLVKPNTRLVAVTAASNVTGKKPPLKKIRSALPDSILFLCDGAQGGGHFPIHMQGAGIDLLTLAGHKGLMAIQGSGALLFSERVNPKPLLFGGTGSLSVSLDMPDFYPDALEAGTASFPAILSLLEGLRYLSAQSSAPHKRTLAFTAYLIKALRQMPAYRLFSEPNESGIVAFSHESLQSEALAALLSSRYAIAVRGGLHCAPLMHEALGTRENGLVRVSFSHFNEQAEIDELIRALTQLQNPETFSNLL